MRGDNSKQTGSGMKPERQHRKHFISIFTVLDVSLTLAACRRIFALRTYPAAQPERR